MVSKYHTDPLFQQDYKFSDSLLFYKERIFLPNKMELRQSIIREYYTTPAAGHSGLKPTLARLAATFLLSWSIH
jgi:hypothetical protein